MLPFIVSTSLNNQRRGYLKTASVRVNVDAVVDRILYLRYVNDSKVQLNF